MRYILFAIFLLFLSCNKEKKELQKKTELSVLVKGNKKLSTGEIVEDYVSVGFIKVWKSNSSGDVRIKDPIDAANGYAFNYATNLSVKEDYSFSGLYSINQELPAGMYLIWVLLDGNNDYRNFAYSSITIQVTEGQVSIRKKVFTTHAKTLTAENWGATE